MICTLLGWLGAGRLPGELLSQHERENALYVCETVSSSMTLRNFRSPHRCSSFKYQWSCGALAVTKTRLVTRRGFRTSLDIELDSPQFRALQISAESDSTLLIVHDASVAHPSWTGTVEHRFYQVDAEYLLKSLQPFVNATGNASKQPEHARIL